MYTIQTLNGDLYSFTVSDNGKGSVRVDVSDDKSYFGHADIESEKVFLYDDTDKFLEAYSLVSPYQEIPDQHITNCRISENLIISIRNSRLREKHEQLPMIVHPLIN